MREYQTAARKCTSYIDSLAAGSPQVTVQIKSLKDGQGLTVMYTHLLRSGSFEELEQVFVIGNTLCFLNLVDRPVLSPEASSLIDNLSNRLLPGLQAISR